MKRAKHPQRKLWGMKIWQIGVLTVLCLTLCLLITGASAFVIYNYAFLTLPQSEQSPILASNPTAIPPTQAITSSFPPPIPGLTYNEIKSHLAEQWISCSPMQRDAISYSATCNYSVPAAGFYVDVEIYSGNQPEDIYLILAYVRQLGDHPSDEVAINTLGYIATLPFDNAQPEYAKQWVSQYLPTLTPTTLVGDEPVTQFGGVIFHMSCHELRTRCLAIGQSSDSPFTPQNIESYVGSPFAQEEEIQATAPMVIPPTLVVTATPLPSGSSFIVNHWQVQVTRVELTEQTEFYGEITQAAGRFLILFLSVTNIGETTDSFIGTHGYIDVMDASYRRFEEDSVASFRVQTAYNMPVGAGLDIAPMSTVVIAVVYDISEQSDYYLLVPGILANQFSGNVLIDIP